MSRLTLRLRTPRALVLDQPVDAVIAEDRTGWFGVRPGRLDLVAVLPPGLLAWRDAAGEGFAAVSGGLLALRSGVCTVLTLEATLGREPEEVADAVARERRRRTERAELHRGVVRDLAREALRRLIREAP